MPTAQAGTISVYARNRDYHDLIKGALKRIATQFAARAGADVKVFVDTAPVMEKPLAEAAGLGWQGKHTNLVSRDVRLLALSRRDLHRLPSSRRRRRDRPLRLLPGLPRHLPDERLSRRPTASMRGAASPISPSSTHGPIPRELRPLIGNRIFGCDDCLAVCPWNKFAEKGRQAKLSAREDLKAPRLEELARLDDAAFRRFFAGSPIKRIGRARFVRNVLIAIGNSGEAALAPRGREADRRRRGRTCAAPRSGRCNVLQPGRVFDLAVEKEAHEHHPDVRDEWTAATSKAGS